MKTRSCSPAHLGLLVALLSPALLAAEAVVPTTAEGWHPQTLGQALGYMLLFAAVGFVAALVGYKAFDLLTPGNLHREIFENRNVAAAVVGAAVILGVCLIVAAAMVS